MIPKNSNNDKKIKKAKNILSRILISIILVLIASIYIKLDDGNSELLDNYLFNNTFEFTSFSNLYSSIFGNILPTESDNTTLVFGSDLTTNPYTEYLDGYMVSVSTNSTINTITGGVVVYIGNMDDYGNTVIIQGNDGIDYWYGSITNVSVSLYDYVESNYLIGESISDYIYLVFQKDNEYLTYEEVI